MAKKAEMPQLSVRVPREVMAVIELVANFEDASLQELFEPLVLEWVQRYSLDPHIRAALASKEQFQKQRGRKVVPIKPAQVESVT